MLYQERPPDKESGPSFFGRLLRRVDGCALRFIFDDKPDSSRVAIDDIYNQTRERLHLYSWRETVRGRVVLTPTGSSYRHNGILIEFIGTVCTVANHESRVTFLHQQRRFEADIVTQPTPFDFEFASGKEYESYRGINTVVSYHVKVTVQRTVKNITQKEEVWVTRVDEKMSEEHAVGATRRSSYFREDTFGPESVSMEVGVDDLVHIEFRYNKKVFHMDEQVLGTVTFKAADMNIQYGEIGVLRKEYIDVEGTEFESETLQKFEVMDGTPIVGEVVPIRLYLHSVPRLTPTYRNVFNCFRVLYFLNLVLVTAENKRYFKQQEITIYRAHGQGEPVGMEPFRRE